MGGGSNSHLEVAADEEFASHAGQMGRLVKEIRSYGVSEVSMGYSATKGRG